MIEIDKEWGTVNFIFFTATDVERILNELSREGNPLRILDDKRQPFVPNVVLHFPEDISELMSVIWQLDKSVVNTLHFISHGIEGGKKPGVLYYSAHESPFPLNEFFRSTSGNDQIIMNLMSVCYQQEYDKEDFKHLIISGNRSPKMGIDSINHALAQLYPFAPLDIDKREFQKNDTYIFKY
ncbi:MAG TPA: hypothetical protein VGQ59_03545 [Cyclobacteriaceae bacterium]|jgi:hypothetical protein|nr:hypothetical protein [Cyclobacteriaceae bacterium]